MTSLFPAMRAAEEFDSVLAGTADPAVADRHAGLLATVEVLRTQPEVMARADFVSELRERLMLAAQTELAPAPGVPSLAAARSSRLTSTTTTTTTRRHRRLGSIAASLVILGGSAGMAAAAAGALPGDSLYPIKRGGEKLNAAMRLSEASRGRVLLSQAENRLAEVGELVTSGADPDLIARTVGAFNAAADSGSDKLFVSFQREGNPADITAVRVFAAEQMATIGRLSTETDPANGTALVEAADTLADIDQAARVLCNTCGPESPAAPPATLTAGAAAANLDSLLASPAARLSEQLEARQIADLQRAAQEAAGRTPAAPTTEAKPATPAGGPADEPTEGTITRDGKLVPSLGVDTAVKDLVTGVTGAVKGATGSTETGVPALDDAVDDLTDTVDGVTGDLLP